MHNYNRVQLLQLSTIIFQYHPRILSRWCEWDKCGIITYHPNWKIMGSQYYSISSTNPIPSSSTPPWFPRFHPDVDQALRPCPSRPTCYLHPTFRRGVGESCKKVGWWIYVNSDLKIFSEIFVSETIRTLCWVIWLFGMEVQTVQLALRHCHGQKAPTFFVQFPYVWWLNVPR